MNKRIEYLLWGLLLGFLAGVQFQGMLYPAKEYTATAMFFLGINACCIIASIIFLDRITIKKDKKEK